MDTYGEMDEEVARFLDSVGVEPNAADALRALPSHLQRAVIERGNLDNARNPSSVLLSRIRDARKETGTHDQPRDDWEGRTRDRAGAAAYASADDYLVANPVDLDAETTFRQLDQESLDEVMKRDVNTARNPSSALLARIKDVLKDLCGPGQPVDEREGRTRDRTGDNMYKSLDDYLAANEVDDKAIFALKELEPWLLEEVMKRDVNTARNPSSALLARIRDVTADKKGSGGGGGAPGKGKGKGAQYLNSGLSIQDGVEEFIRNNSIDDRGADALRRCDRKHQEEVLDRGDLVGVRNPSSALLARIRDAEMNGSGGYGSGGNSGPAPDRSRDSGWHRNEAPAFAPAPAPQGMDMTPMPVRLIDDLTEFLKYHSRGRDAQHVLDMLAGLEYSKQQGAQGGGNDVRGRIEAFLQANHVDHTAADTLRRCSPHAAQLVLDRGIEGARNPSSALLARIRDAEAGHFDSRGGDGGIHGEIDNFVKQHGIDDRAADSLRRAHPDVQREVISKGIVGARNPSSALQARIKDMEKSRGGDRGGGGRGRGRSRSRSRRRH